MNNDERGTIGKEKQEKLRGLPGMARKISQEAKLLEQAAQRTEAKRVAEHERVRAIANTAFGGGFTRLLKESTILTPEEKDFLKELKYI